MPLPRSLAALVARQDGVVTRRQAMAHGISARTVARWVAEGAWTRVRSGVYLVQGHQPTPRATTRAAVLWAGDGATLSGLAAAWWHGLCDIAPRPGGRPVDVTVPPTGRSRSERGVRIHRSALGRADRTVHRGLAVLRPPLAVLQAAVTVPRGSQLLDRALQQGVTLDELRRCRSRNLGFAGSAAMGRLITAASDGAESHAERMLLTALRAAGLSGWTLGHPVGPYRIDIAFPHVWLAIEVDGWAWHSDTVRFQADRRKGNALVKAGWRLLRFTWHDLDADPAGCVAQIAATVRKVPPVTPSAR